MRMKEWKGRCVVIKNLVGWGRVRKEGAREREGKDYSFSKLVSF
jgi:hypothetical protein